MLNSIKLYNFFHSGDIFVSRSLVNFVVNNIEANDYIYHHVNSYKILKDISKLRYELRKLPESYKYGGWFIENNNLWCNTWYNAYHEQEFKGCTIQTLFDIFKRGLKETLNFDLPGICYDYIPEINFNYFDLDRITNFMVQDNSIKVLICNCNVLSGQSYNFDFNPIINYLADNYRNFKFIITNIMGDRVIKENVFYFSDLFHISDGDLNEIAYLSKFCDVIVGRHSGPFAFCFIKDNIYNINKKFIGFSHENNFGIMDVALAKFVSSQDYSIDGVVNVINNELKELV